MSGYGWAYRCSACGNLVEVDDVRSHLDGHKARKDYSGASIDLTREDKPAEERKP